MTYLCCLKNSERQEFYFYIESFNKKIKKKNIIIKFKYRANYIDEKYF